jgi:hypothetical protein
MQIAKPGNTEYPSYYHTYIGKVPYNDLIIALKTSGSEFADFIRSVPADKLSYRYADGKWTIKEIIGHIIDAERVFTYRAMRFSRNDKTALPGFDENIYVPESRASERTITELIEEYEAVRASSIAFFTSITPQMAERTGICNGNEISVRAFGFIIPGHEIHHMQVIKERYL